MQAGYGVWYGEGDACKFAAHVPVHELGVLQALLPRGSARLAMGLDSEHVY